MKTDDLIYRSIFIITEYYKNNLEPFFESLSEDVLWVGPSGHQLLQGKENLIRAWAAEKHALTFTMGDIKVLCISPHSHVKEIFLRYPIYTHYPSGNTDMHGQRLQYTWREKRIKTGAGWESRPEIVMLHISNAWKYDSRDSIYPVHYESLSVQEPLSPHSMQSILVKASDMSVHRIIADHVLYIETIKRSARLLVHTRDETLTVSGTLPGLETAYPGLFLRVHASYLVNPVHVQEIRRFSITLSDGTQLPVPEKKYTKIKKIFLQENLGVIPGL